MRLLFLEDHRLPAPADQPSVANPVSASAAPVPHGMREREQIAIAGPASLEELLIVHGRVLAAVCLRAEGGRF